MVGREDVLQLEDEGDSSAQVALESAAVYALLAVCGLIATWYFNLAYLAAGGSWVDVPAVLRLAYANEIASSFSSDLFVAFAAFVVFSLIETRRIGMRRGWIYPLLGLFLAFAFGYFFAAVLRAITATLSPVLTREFQLDAGDLGLLAGGYFLGFALIQLPLGAWLDRHGPRKVTVSFSASMSFSGWSGGMFGFMRRRASMLPSTSPNRPVSASATSPARACASSANATPSMISARASSRWTFMWDFDSPVQPRVPPFATRRRAARSRATRQPRTVAGHGPFAYP